MESSVQDVMYETLEAMDNQDEPLENYPDRIMGALDRAGFVIVPIDLPYEVLGEAAICCGTGNPKDLWNFVLNNVRHAWRRNDESTRKGA